jgi:hypothetical protein
MPIPSSIIRFGNAPLTKPDSGVCYSRTFSSAAEQKAWFMARLTNVKEGNTEIRPYSGRYGAPWNADDIITSDYMMFTNDGAKWYYAFIDRVVYVNEQRCDIYFTIDDLQTWYFDYTLRPVYVEREHAADDSIGANILDEPISTGELRYAEQDSYDDMMDCVLVVDTTEQPDGVGVIGNQKKKDCKGGYINGQYSGCGKVVFDIGSGSVGAAAPDIWFSHMNQTGGGASIIAAYMVPKVVLKGADDSYFFKSGENIFDTYPEAYPIGGVVDPAITAHGAIDGYKPRNNKLYTYPYNFMRVSNLRGGYHDYRFEFFGKSLRFIVKGSVDPTGDVVIIPMNYNGKDNNPEEIMNLGGYAQCSWAYNSYDNYVAQNAASNLFGYLGGAAMVIGGAAAVLGGSAFSPIPLTLAGFAEGTMFGNWTDTEPKSTTKGLMSAGAGAATAAGLGARMLDASNAPDKLMGSTSNSSNFQLNRNKFVFNRMCCQRQFAERIDQFFDVYGYTTQRVKTPDRSSRPHVNYCKTRDAQFQGTVPADAMDRINRVWNQGIWWFHDDNIGDFSIANK